jgi:predicted RNA polymerase sigma factor
VTHPQVRPDPAFGLLQLYDDALPHVYGYLLARCGDTGLAEDLTAESFLAAVHAVRKPGAPDPSIPLTPTASPSSRARRCRSSLGWEPHDVRLCLPSSLQ